MTKLGLIFFSCLDSNSRNSVSPFMRDDSTVEIEEGISFLVLHKKIGTHYTFWPMSEHSSTPSTWRKKLVMLLNICLAMSLLFCTK